MGICEVLTIVFIVLKLVGTISWSWWLVLLPEIIAFGWYSILIGARIWLAVSIKKQQRRLFHEMWRHK